MSSLLRNRLAPKHTKWFNYRHQVASQLKPFLRPGDIFVRKGNHVFNYFVHFSRFVEWLTKSKYSHASLVYRVEADDVVLAEVSDYGVRRIYLLDWLDELQGSDFLVLRYNGSPYGSYEIIEAATHFIRLDLPYNTDLDLEKQNSLYCVQFIYKCFECAGISLAPGKSLEEMPNWKSWLKLIARLLSYPINKPIYFVGNEEVGLLSSKSLSKVMHVKLSEVKQGKALLPCSLDPFAWNGKSEQIRQLVPIYTHVR